MRVFAREQPAVDGFFVPDVEADIGRIAGKSMIL